MTINIGTLARNRAGAAITDLINTGSVAPGGYLETRSGLKPTTPQVAATGILLCTNNFSNPSFGNYTNGSSNVNTIANGTIVANGTAGWFRIYNRDGVAVLDGDISITGGTGNLQFPSTSFLLGGTVAITSGTATMPQ